MKIVIKHGVPSIKRSFNGYHYGLLMVIGVIFWFKSIYTKKVSVISSDHVCKDDNARFTTETSKALSDQS